MSLLEKLKEKKKQMQEQMQRGREVTQQMKAEKMRKKIQKAKNYEKGTIRYGLFHKQKTLDLMRDVWEKRREKRKQNQK